MNIILVSLFILASLAVFDLVVGVSNDAVNFLNSSIGSKVAPMYVILIIASFGILAGVTFSSGMMEVARKGIFNPQSQYFVMPDLIVIFLAVMITDILLLDLFNTFGLPTSTTVSIVFELLGAAVAVSIIKITQAGDSLANLSSCINSGKALAIISGILLSVIVAFCCGAIVQYVTRLIFTFDYHKRMKRYGGLWGGVALSMITYFILIKGAKGASFISAETLSWISTHTFLIIFGSFVVFAVIFQALLAFTRINILKPIVLIGTFALAMAFAANDLVNFIGVPMAGMNAYMVAKAAADPLTASMAALQAKVPTNTYLLLLAGLIMVVTLWFSKKARTVTETEVNLGRQDEGIERFGSSPLSRVVVRMASVPIDLVKKYTPSAIGKSVGLRLRPPAFRQPRPPGDEAPSFDLLRASVNLMVASAVVSYATSQTLPLSTTYVTFMVAMGTSLSDQAWGRETAVYRVTGVLTVIGGWFLTAMAAFTVSLVFGYIIYHFRLVAAILLLAFVVFMICRNHQLHSKRKEDVKSLTSFSLKKVTSAQAAISMSFEHAGAFLKEVGDNLANAFDGLFMENRTILKAAREKTRKIQLWANVIMANIFKTLYLLKKYDLSDTQKYISTIRSLQEIAESHRDLVIRAYQHVDNVHAGVSKEQRQELEKIKDCVVGLLMDVSGMLIERKPLDYDALSSQREVLLQMVATFELRQIERIHRRETKTRLSILFYGYLDGCVKISDQTLALVNIFRESFMVENGLKGADTTAP